MGRMKEIFMDIYRANKDQLPKELTIGDVARMKELEIYNWKEYERELKKSKEENISYNSEKNQKIIKDEENTNDSAIWSSDCPF
jgi:tRNA A37 threonylcarbamoyladenosine biosynthesis protein TsaE